MGFWKSWMWNWTFVSELKREAWYSIGKSGDLKLKLSEIFTAKVIESWRNLWPHRLIGPLWMDKDVAIEGHKQALCEQSSSRNVNKHVHLDLNHFGFESCMGSYSKLSSQYVCHVVWCWKDQNQLNAPNVVISLIQMGIFIFSKITTLNCNPFLKST